jgi:hypothetical protein
MIEMAIDAPFFFKTVAIIAEKQKVVAIGNNGENIEVKMTSHSYKKILVLVMIEYVIEKIKIAPVIEIKTKIIKDMNLEIIISDLFTGLLNMTLIFGP